MKRIVGLLLVVLTVCITAAAFSMPASAEEEEVKGTCGTDGNLCWELNGDTLHIYGHGNMENYDDWDETPWYPYGALEKVKHVVVDGSITRIGSYAFAKFANLESITLGEGIEFIEDYAFYCAATKNDVDLVIPSTVFYIGQYAFGYAYGLKNVTILSDYDALPYYVKGETYHPVMGDEYQKKHFLNDRGNIKADGVYIQYRAFYYCTNMTTLSIGNPDKKNEKNLRIGESAFENCESLHTIRFADSLDQICYSAFCDCYALRNVWYYGPKTKFANVSIDHEYNYNYSLRYVLEEDGGRRFTYTDEGVHTYLDKDGNVATLDGTKERCWVLNDSITNLDGGWYIVNRNVNYGEKPLIVSKDSNILLLDHCGIESAREILVNDTTLGIYAQSSDQNTMGYIKVTNSQAGRAAIGGNSGETHLSTVMICGGKIEAHGGMQGAGIGSGYVRSTVIITGGFVSAYGGKWGAGIGSGNYGECDITISGGHIIAQGGEGGAGIGSGYGSGSSCDITISGGDIHAQGGERGAGIGSGGYNSNCVVTISGGNINAQGGRKSAGIGLGGDYGAFDIVIHDGTVEAHGGEHGAGIGSGENTSGYGSVQINGGTIRAQGGSGADGIRNGYDEADTVTLNGGSITAIAGGPDAHDIGGNIKDNRNKTGALLSEGNVWIIVTVAVVAVAVVTALAIVKKNKKPALADGTEDKDGK